MGFGTESEVMGDRESLEGSFLLEPQRPFPLEKLQRRLRMSQRCGRGAPELKEVEERLAGGHRAFKNGLLYRPGRLPAKKI